MTLFRCFLTCCLFIAQPALAESPRIIGTIGQQMEISSPEASLRYVGSPFLWKFQPAFGLSLARNESAWVGAGKAVTWRSQDSGLFLRWTSMAGIHRRGNGRNLGGPIQFRNAFDAGLLQRNGTEIGIGFDHRSSANIYRPNPGLNTAYLFASFPLR